LSELTKAVHKVVHDATGMWTYTAYFIMYSVVTLLAVWGVCVNRAGIEKNVQKLFNRVEGSQVIAFICIGMTYWAPNLMQSKPNLNFILHNYY
jgi:hypothetical protein